MNPQPTYTVTVTRENQEWCAVLSDTPEGYAGGLQFDHFSSIKPAMTELTCDLLDLNEEDFTLNWVYNIGSSADLITDFFAAQEARTRFLALRKTLVKQLAPHIGGRATADLMNISHQRVAQLRREV